MSGRKKTGRKREKHNAKEKKGNEEGRKEEIEGMWMERNRREGRTKDGKKTKIENTKRNGSLCPLFVYNFVIQGSFSESNSSIW